MTDEAKEQPSAVVPDGSPSDEKKKAAPSRKKLYLFLACIALIVAVLCVVLPLTLRNKSDSSDSSSSDDSPLVVVDTEESQSGGDGVTISPVADPAATDPTDETSRLGDETDPDADPAGATDTDPTDAAETDPDPEPAVVTEGSGTYTFVQDSLMSLPLFGSDITTGYENQADLEGALRIALRVQAQQIIDQNVRNMQNWYGYNDFGREPEVAEDGDMMGMDDPAAADFSAAESAGGAAGGGAAPDGGVTDFETNNQEANVDEADSIKADENYIYAAYGDYIVIWDTAGNQVHQEQMPPIDLPDDWGQPPKPFDPETEVGRTQQKSSMFYPEPNYIPRPNIRSMLLTDDHLIVMVNGYGNDYTHYWGRPQGMPEPDRNVLYGYKACQIRVYEKNGDGSLSFAGSKDVNGNFVDARSIGDTVHLATASTLDTWSHLGQPLELRQVANGTQITHEEYESRASRIADAIVPKVVDKLIEELKVDGGELPTLLQVNQWFTQVNNTSDGSTAGFDLPQHTSYDVISNMAQVTSFDVSEAVGVDGGLKTSASAYMAPNYFNTLYGTGSHLVLATSGWDWSPFRGEAEQTTYLVALEIDGAETKFLSVGTLKGHLLNSYALDIVGDELRAATTVERNSWWWGPIDGPMPFMMEDVDTLDMPVAQARGGGRRTLVEEICGEPNEEDECWTAENYEHCAVLVERGCSLVERSEDCPQTYTCAIIGEDLNGVCPPLDDIGRDVCLNNENMQRCINLSTMGCTAIEVEESCPVQFQCNFEEMGEMDPTGLCPRRDDDCMNDDNYLDCLSLVMDGCEEVMFLESCPLQFACQREDVPPPVDEPFPEEPPEESRTENYMVVLKLVGEDVPVGQMSEKGRVQIGEKNERITSVRFFDNVAYAVTFERTDPFYVVDMSVPQVLGELKLPGFSSYLHSMNADNTLLLAVGQDATDEGRELGLMVTVFDATDPADPKAVVSHTFENDENAYSSSSVQWDYKAFRYVDSKLVIPMEIWYHQQWDSATQQYLPLPPGAENFRGFAVLDISTTAITEQFRVSHIKPEGYCNYCGGYLPQRSFVYNGDLMTVKENLVVSTGLSSGEEKWRFGIQVEGEVADCCW